MKLFKKHKKKCSVSIAIKHKKKFLALITIMSFLFILAGSITPAFADHNPTGSDPNTQVSSSGTSSNTSTTTPINTSTNNATAPATNSGTTSGTTTDSNPNNIDLKCNMFDMNCKIEEFFLNLVQGTINYSVQQLQNFVVTPQSILQDPTISSFYDSAYNFSFTIILVIFLYKLIEFLALADYDGAGRVIFKEKLFKLLFTVAFASGYKWIFEYLLYINNWIIEGLLKGCHAQFASFKYNQTKIMEANINLTFMVFLCFFFAILFFILTIQMAKRFAELGLAFAIAPIIIATNVSDNFNLLPGFWKNIFSLIFTQALQVLLILWMVKLFASGSIWDPNQILKGIGVMLVIVTVPHIVREYVYSSGTGKTFAGMAAGATATAFKTAWLKKA